MFLSIKYVITDKVGNQSKTKGGDVKSVVDHVFSMMCQFKA